MLIDLDVGSQERHHVEFSWNPMWGNWHLSVDGAMVTQGLNTFSLTTKKVFEFVVGENEKHLVRIEKSRPWLFAGFRKNIFKSFIDDAFADERKGY